MAEKLESDCRAANDVDPELDICSDQFNPLKALHWEGKLAVDENAPIYDNISIFESRIKRTDLVASKPGTASQSKKTKQDCYLPPVDAVRRFLPHQGMVKGTGKKIRQSRNLLQTMCAAMEKDGPLKWLEICRVERKRVKILLRNETTINGHVTGFVEAYDKHWNIALSDVVHVWKRKKPHFCTTAMSASTHDDATDGNDMEECMQRLQRLGIDVPAINVKSINRKFAECTRSVAQLVVRGEQIALVHSDALFDHSLNQ